MPSLIRRPNGCFELQYLDSDEKRQAIYLGKILKRNAEAAKVKIEDLISSKLSGGAMKDETALWVSSVALPMKKKLHRKRLNDIGISEEERKHAELAAAKEAERKSRDSTLPRVEALTRSTLARSRRRIDIRCRRLYKRPRSESSNATLRLYQGGRLRTLA